MLLNRFILIKIINDLFRNAYWNQCIQVPQLPRPKQQAAIGYLADYVRIADYFSGFEKVRTFLKPFMLFLDYIHYPGLRENLY